SSCLAPCGQLIASAVMKVTVVKETEPGEHRVALVPEAVGRLADAGFEVAVEPGAGLASLYPDDTYRDAGATITPTPLDGADLVVSVQPLGVERIQQLRAGAITVSFLPVAQALDQIRTMRDAKVTSFAMEFIPRISRAQAMD